MPTETSQAVLSLCRIGQIALTVENIARATTFYRDVLKLPFLFQTGDMAFFDCNGVRLMLSEPESDPPYVITNSVLYFQVDDLQKSYEELQGQGVAFDDGPHLIARLEMVEVWMCFFRDSENNVVGLMSEPAI